MRKARKEINNLMFNKFVVPEGSRLIFNALLGKYEIVTEFEWANIFKDMYKEVKRKGSNKTKKIRLCKLIKSNIKIQNETTKEAAIKDAKMKQLNEFCEDAEWYVARSKKMWFAIRDKSNAVKFDEYEKVSELNK